MKFELSDLNKNLSYEELFLKYKEALWCISDQQIEIQELHQEVNDYCYAFDKLQDELSVYR